MLLPFTKKRHDTDAGSAEATLGNAGSYIDYIPYHSHFNHHTLLTKNGELLQIIKIASNTSGLNYESGDNPGSTVRETLRQAIAQHITSDRFALWIHTIRKRRPIGYKSVYKNPFAAYVYEKWQKKYRWKHQYYNEVYLTLLHEGQSGQLLDKTHLKDAVFPKSNRAWRNLYLDQSYRELDRVSTALLESIRVHYNAHRLSVTERMPPEDSGITHPIFYSEPMEFLGTLVNLRGEAFPLTESTVCSALNNHAVTFGYNALETKKGAAGSRRFAALLTLKHYVEVPADTVDHVLQSPIELIISQSFNFTPHKNALKNYREQKSFFDTSGDAYSMKHTGLEYILASNHKQPTDFGESQTSIMVMIDEYKHLESEVVKAQTAFGEFGLITVREDIMLEEAYWAQLPGNFEFIRRKDVISTSHIAGFSRLNRFPTGTDVGNHWRDAVTMVPTQVGSPYFFNFHHQDNGHTVLFDYNSFHDQAAPVLLNFLLTSALKYDGRLIVFDRHQSSKLWFDKLGGEYHGFDPKQPLKLNPFSLEDTPRNRGFLLAWCVSLIEPLLPVEAAQRDMLKSAIDHVYAGTPERRNIAGLVSHLSSLDPSLTQAFSAYIGQGKYAYLLDSMETLSPKAQALAFNMDAAFTLPSGATALFAYLLHRIVTGLDGTPTIIVLHEAWDLLENAFFAPRLESLLEMLKQHNAMVIFTTSNPPAAQGTRTLATLMASCATRLYLPDDVAQDYAAQTLGLNSQDMRMLSSMRRDNGDFLIKQNNESIALTVGLDDLGEVKPIFANDIKNLAAAGGKYASVPKAS